MKYLCFFHVPGRAGFEPYQCTVLMGTSLANQAIRTLLLRITLIINACYANIYRLIPAFECKESFSYISFLLCFFTVPPQIMNISSDITVNEGSSVTLLCLAIGRPEPTVTWRHLSVKGKPFTFGNFSELFCYSIEEFVLKHKTLEIRQQCCICNIVM